MVRGLYTASSGMLVESLRSDVVANNVANVNTVGFKRDRSVVAAFPDMFIHRIHDQPEVPHKARADHKPVPVGRLGTGAALEGTWTDFQPGALRYTGRALDVALVEDGFFAVQDGEDVLFTRNGQFYVNAEGVLTNAQGQEVVGVDGPIVVSEPDGSPVNSVVISRTGEVTADNEIVGQLAMYQFENPEFLQRLGDNMWQQTDDAGEMQIQAALVEAEHVEQSNVNVVSEMVKMIQVQRAYEANQRVIQAHDEVLGRAVNDISAF